MDKANLPHADETKATLSYDQFLAAVMSGESRWAIDMAIASGETQPIWEAWDSGETVWDTHYDLGYRRVLRKADRNA